MGLDSGRSRGPSGFGSVPMNRSSEMYREPIGPDRMEGCKCLNAEHTTIALSTVTSLDADSHGAVIADDIGWWPVITFQNFFYCSFCLIPDALPLLL